MRPYYEADGVTLYLGDCRDVIASLPAGSVDALITDPPYSSGGMMRGDRTVATSAKYVSNECRAAAPEFEGDTRDQRGFLAWCSLWLADVWRVAADGAIAVQFTDWRQLPTSTDALQAGGWVWRGIIPWDKTEGARPTLGGFRNQCEYAIWGSKGAIQPERNPVALPGYLRQSTDRNKIHIAQKPIEVMGWLVRACPPGGLVLDPFAGSGRTLVAARNEGRRAIGVELLESNCALIADALSQRVLPLGGVA